MMKRVPLFLIVVFAGAFALFANTFANTTTNAIQTDSFNKIMQHPEGLSPKLLKLGLEAYQWAQHHGQVTKPYLTIVDLSMPSKYPRLWVIDLNTNRVTDHLLVANGKNSGVSKATRFSNQPGSKESSLGVYITGGKYYGDVGLAMRLYGLQPGINSNAYRRAIVMHGNWYVSKTFAKANGRVGRSYGCFTLSKAKVGEVVAKIKNGSVLYAYADHQPGAIQFLRLGGRLTHST